MYARVPALFRLAIERAGATALDTVMIGDSYERDVLGARGAGIARAVLVDRHRPSELVRGAAIGRDEPGLPGPGGPGANEHVRLPGV